jgi:hypothetical protein
MALNRARVARDISLNNDMSFMVLVEFFDSAAPSTVLWSETFVVPASATTTQLQAQVVARGQAIRQGLANLATAQATVPNGTVTTVP